jgi:hypothetical protein
MSPYSFAGNSPIAFIDYEGEHPLVAFAVIGFFVGGATEFVRQVLEGVFTGKSLKESFKKVDWADVLNAGVFTSLDVMSLGMSKLLTGSAHAALNAEFDYKLYDEDGNWIKNGMGRSKYGFGSGKHEKDKKEVIKDGVLGMVSTSIDLLADLGGKVAQVLDDHMTDGQRKVVEGLVQTFGVDEYTYPMTDQAAGLALTPHDSYVGVEMDKLYDRAQPSHTRKVNRMRHHRIRDTNKKINLKRPKSSTKLHSPYKDLQFTDHAHNNYKKR